jgi:pyruvate/2-oxoglutarate dehydrogenase complex dihydrolipoamide dehydrogenase (E3) component
MTKTYDAIIIGTGQAGPSLAVDLAKQGLKVAIIERKLFGGTCVNTGCIPSKTMYESARKAHLARTLDFFGIEIDQPKINLKKIVARKEDIVEHYRAGLKNWLEGTQNCDVYEGQARFIDNYTIQVNDTLITANKLFINVGGRALIPDIPGIAKINYLTNSTIMELDQIPKHLIILGGSYVGLEFAQMFKRFGSEVTIIEQGERLISREDEEISNEIKNILENENINILLSTKLTSLENSGEQISISLNQNGKAYVVKGSHLLVATGRKPNTDDLGLENTDLKLDERGYLVVDDELNTAVPGIYALGDCNGKGAFTHTSYNDYQIVIANLLKPHSKSVNDRVLAYNLYIDPPLGRVGQNEQDFKNTNRKILVAKMEMRSIKRAVIKGETQGFMKVFIDKETNKILGASILGVEGDEIIHIFLDMMYAGAEYTVIKNAMHIHPTIAELIPTMLETLKPL